MHYIRFLQGGDQDQHERKSIAGYLFMIGEASISWISKKQQAIWIEMLLEELKFTE